MLAQDVDPFFAMHFQTMLDPSRAGSDQAFSCAFMHRDQWSGLDGPYRTNGLVLEHAIGMGSGPRKAWLGLGATFTDDRMGGRLFRNQQLGFAPSVHLPVSKRDHLSFGLGFTLDQFTSGVLTGSWAGQYDGMRFIAGAPSGESFDRIEQFTTGFCTGVSFTRMTEPDLLHQEERPAWVIGIAVAHLAPNTLQQAPLELYASTARYTAYVLKSIPLSIWPQGTLQAEMVAHAQGPHTTARINLTLGREVFRAQRISETSATTGFRIGVGYRYQDALLVNAAFERLGVKVGFAYGWSIGRADRAINGPRTSEIFIGLKIHRRKLAR